jgi:hypothetical protein
MLCILILVITALPVGAAGPYDGIWFTNQSCPSVGLFRTFVSSVTENDNFGTYWGVTFNTVLFVLDPVTGIWNVDFGTRIDSTLQGVVFDSFGTQQGTFTITASNPTTITGTAQIEGVSCSLTGTRVF